jgi:hypothetical protein
MVVRLRTLGDSCTLRLPWCWDYGRDRLAWGATDSLSESFHRYDTSRDGICSGWSCPPALFRESPTGALASTTRRYRYRWHATFALVRFGGAQNAIATAAYLPTIRGDRCCSDSCRSLLDSPRDALRGGCGISSARQFSRDLFQPRDQGTLRR